jgi:hypothetical protein
VAELRPPPDHVILVAGGKLPSQPLVVAVVALILIAVSVPIARRQGRIGGDPRLVKLLMIALLLHLLGSAATIFVDNHVYHGVADFTQYVHRGALISKNFRSFHFTTAGSGINTSLGDGSVSVAAGVVFSIIGVNELGAFFVFAWLSWLGSIFFYRAFCITFPEGGHRRYALMLFLLPSLLYWTSDVSKESVVMLALGVTTLGAARVFVRQPRGDPLIALGTAIGIATRPDEFAILFGAFTVSLLFRRQTSRPELRAVRRLGTILFLIVVLGVTALLTAKFLKSSASGAHSLSDILNKAHKNNSAAQLGTTNVPYSSDPLLYPRDVYEVLFDPLPITARSLTQFIAAAENSVIFVLIVTSLRRLRLVFRAGRERPYVLLCAAYCAAFIYAFAALANLGLITRERTLMFPYLLVLLAIPMSPKGKPPIYPWERPRVKRRDQRLAKARGPGYSPSR